MSLDLYGILGVTFDATLDDIKVAYRKKAIQYHPDKCSDLDAHDRMTNLNHAFETLGNEDKRRCYDASRIAHNVEWGLMKSLFESMVNHYHSNAKTKTKTKTETEAKTSDPEPGSGSKSRSKSKSKSKPITKPGPIDVELVVDLSDLCRDPPAMKKVIVKVRRLDGTIERKCIFLSLLNYVDSYTYNDMGDEYAPGLFTDMIVKLIVRPHEHFKIDMIINHFDVHYERKVNLDDYFNGFSEMVTHVDGVTAFPIKYVGGDTSCCIEGMGIPYVDEFSGDMKKGDLFIFFNLEMPLINDIDPARLADFKMACRKLFAI